MAKAKGGLGKGLGALLPIYDEEEILKESAQEVRNINLAEIMPNPEQPRKVFDEDEMIDLAASITEHGVLVPIIVNKTEANEKYVIVAGERRYRAANRAGLVEIPAIVKNFSEQEMLEIALIENVQRSDLNAIEEARGYKLLMERFGYSAEDLAKRMGKSRPQVANSVRLLNLPDEVITMVAEGKLTAGHARALLALGDSAWQIELAEDIYRDALSVRQVESLVNNLKNNSETPKKEIPEKSKDKYDEDLNTELKIIQEQLKEVFKTKVAIKNRGGKGKIEINFYNEDELKRIIDLLGGEFY